jgi:phage shock protein PspC (stress-responsive transcriptional regulator)
MRRVVVFVLGLAVGLVAGYLIAELTAPIEPLSDEEDEPVVLHAPKV